MRLSKTAIQKYRLCPRKYKLSYLDGYWPDSTGEPRLQFGKVWANGKENWWKGDGLPDTTTLANDQAIVLNEMLAYYDELYDKEAYTVLGTEMKHTIPLNDRTDLTVVFDSLLCYNGHNLLGEDKTTKQDIQSDWYWEKLELDLQTGIYVWAANQLGYETRYVLYDVVRVPPLRIGKEGRKSIEEDEGEFAERVRATLEKNPDKYYQRRTHEPNVERAMDMLMDWEDRMWYAKKTNSYPMNDDGCKAFGRRCEYWRVCSGQELIEESTLLRKGR